MRSLTEINRSAEGGSVVDEQRRRTRLSELLRLVPLQSVAGERELEIRGITSDSRRVEPGYLFVAIEGSVVDGHEFVEEALARGAVSVVSERPAPGRDLNWIQTPDARKALGLLAARVAGDPSRKLDVVGITGTNGKTTTAFLIEGLLDRLEPPAAMMGTVVAKIGSSSRPTRHTTPEASDVQAFLLEALEASCRRVALEVSSHGLALSRLEGTEVEVAVFTNLSRDHLDYHRDMEDYFLTKRQLFTRHLRPQGTAVVCIDDAYGERLASELPARVTSYGLSATADLSIREVDATLSGLRVVFRDASGGMEPVSREIRSPLLGRYNAMNLVAAFAAVRALGFSAESVLQELPHVAAAPGRFENVGAATPFPVIVDYAHTDDALRKLLEAARPLTAGKLWVVIGCGGERDRAKRPLMGDVAARLADRVVFTSDNPRGEDPLAILKEMKLGAKDAPVTIEPDRRRAIEIALTGAEFGDLVVIAGKGHEPYQIVGDTVLDFDDRVVAREIAAGLGKAASG